MTATLDDPSAESLAPMILACTTCNLELALDREPGVFRSQIVSFGAAHDDHPEGWTFQVRIPLDVLSVEVRSPAQATADL